MKAREEDRVIACAEAFKELKEKIGGKWNMQLLRYRIRKGKPFNWVESAHYFRVGGISALNVDAILRSYNLLR